MYHILTMGELSERLQRRINRRERFEFSSQYSDPEAIFVRSALVSDELIKEQLLVIGRAGSGVNTINVKACSQNGTMVFNTPGVNANAVKELVLTSLLNSVRPVEQAAAAVQTLRGADILEKSEKLRNHFVGGELEGKTVGILGLGVIGELVAKACYQLGMDVIGYARQPRQEDYFEQVYDLKELLLRSDFVVILLPLTDETKELFDSQKLSLMRKDAVLFNFGRGEIVDNGAILAALDNNQLKGYVTDFPEEALLRHPKIKLLPHMGGTTEKALQDGALVAMRNMREFLLYGTIRQSVNFPNLYLPFHAPERLTIFYHNQPKTFTRISQIIAEHDVSIDILTSERKAEFVYTIIDLAETDLAKVKKISGEIRQLAPVIRLRVLKNPNWQPTIYL